MNEELYVLPSGDEIAVTFNGQRYGWRFTDCVQWTPNHHFTSVQGAINAAVRFTTVPIKE